MKAFLGRLIFNTLALYALSGLLGDDFRLSGFSGAIFFVLVFSLAHSFVRPALFLFKIVTFPVHWLTLGLSSLIVSLLLNALVLLFLCQLHLIPGVHLSGFGAALKATLLLTIANTIATILFGTGQR
ncbi:MAG: phage holin family protein [Armatimonadetes bacterium]|nr:phage holin family protein [Armatimonadota bacterium]MDW8122185.1 phage holin family protein [Armatimonadota bacterium]